MERISQAEYARRRGTSPAAVCKAVKRHGIPLVDGRLDPRVADALWPASARSTVAVQQAPAGADVRSPALEHALLAKARRERVELETRVRKGELIDAAFAESEARRAGMTVRDAILAIPARVAGEIAGMTDEREIERFLTRIFRDELTRVARSVPPPPAEDNPS